MKIKRMGKPIWGAGLNPRHCIVHGLPNILIKRIEIRIFFGDVCRLLSLKTVSP